MCADDQNHESFDDMLRSIAREVSRSVERAMEQVDVEEIAQTIGVEAQRARDWMETAGQWLRAQSGEAPGPGEQPGYGEHPRREDREHERSAAEEDPLRFAGPHPLDIPSDDQGLALAALDSGRWRIEPGSNAFAAHGEGPSPRDALGLVRELRARDWISSEGEITLAGKHALRCWLEKPDARA